VRPSLLLPALLLAAFALSGCSGNSDKAGGTAPRKSIELRLAVGTDTVELGGFATEVSRLSGGTMRILTVGPWRPGQPSFERGLIDDVRAGKVDLGAVASRAWDSVGVTSFRALGAPFLIDSYPLQERVLTSPMIDEMLAGLRPTGLVGLGVLPGTLRRPLGTRRPLLAPSDYQGLRIGLQQSRLASATLRALGATPVPIGADDPAAGLDGVESHVTAIQNTHQDRHARYLTTNVVLWPRPLVIFANRQTLARLMPAQREILRRAVTADLSRETKHLASFERLATATECSQGRMRFVAAPPADVLALRRAAQPVYDGLERDQQTHRIVAEIERMRHQIGAPVSTVPRCSRDARTQKTAATTPVDGAYDLTVRPGDLPAATRVPEQYGRWQLVLDRGRFRLSEDSDGADWAGDGRVRVSGETMTWTFDHALDWGPHGAPDGVPVSGGDKLVFRWRRSDRSLVLTSRQGLLPGLSVRPLERLANAPSQERLENPSALQGVWASNVTVADYERFGDPGGIADNTGPLRLTVHGSRCRWTQQAPDGFHWHKGTCRYAGDTLEFDETVTDQGPSGVPLFLHWSVFHDRLTLRPAAGLSPVVWGYHPWRRVG
jgi:TRAP-type C4-dicarboxylate transport system substrate-binding protein